MKEFVMRDGKKLRLGYTTGSCAAAAAKAAAWMLLSGSKKESIRLLTPKGMELTLAVEDIHSSLDCVRCAIRKDSGDDPDITRDTLVYAEVRKTEDASTFSGATLARFSASLTTIAPISAAGVFFRDPPKEPMAVRQQLTTYRSFMIVPPKINVGKIYSTL